METLFIVNPEAGKGKAKNLVPIIKEICEEHGVEHKIAYTKACKDGINIAKNACKDGVKRMISVGGDGTLNEVINGIDRYDVELGLLPGGSGNDFIRIINSNKDIRKLIYDNIFGKTKRVDFALCNNQRFVNIASVGLDARIADGVAEMKRFLSGSRAYYASLIKQLFCYSGQRAKIDVDGQKVECDMLLVAVANGEYYGGGIRPVPHADIEDGMLDVCIVRSMPMLKKLVLLPRYIKGKHQDIEGVDFYRGKNIRITSDKIMTVNIDGEIIHDYTIEISMCSEKINIIVPKI